MVDFDDIKYAVSDFIQEKPVLFRITALLVLFVLTALIIIFIQSSPEKPVNSVRNDIILNGTPQIPDSTKIEKDYYPSRVTENTWSEEQVKEYFTPTEGKIIRELESTNDQIVSDMIGAAP